MINIEPVHKCKQQNEWCSWSTNQPRPEIQASRFGTCSLTAMPSNLQPCLDWPDSPLESQSLVTSDRRQVTSDTWQVTNDKWLDVITFNWFLWLMTVDLCIYTKTIQWNFNQVTSHHHKSSHNHPPPHLTRNLNHVPPFIHHPPPTPSPHPGPSLFSQ